MPRGIELRAPAKLNLSLEVLSKRADGYHEVATLMQTIDLYDSVTIEAGQSITVEASGDEASGVPADMEQDLAYRAATRMAYWLKEPAGARITVHKRIPAGMGLGGGSSDGAAVIRGLKEFWGLERDTASLARSAAELGSDAAFFVHCGTALCRGRGEVVDPMVDAQPATVTLFLPSETIEAKTASMYGRLTSHDYSAGVDTRGLVDDVVMKRELVYVRNVFDAHVECFGEKVAMAMEACKLGGFEVHLAGSGPAFFALRAKADLGPRELGLMEYLGIKVVECRFLSREESLLVRDAEA